MAKWAEEPYQGSVYYSLEQKKEHLRAVHNRPGPIGKFIHGIIELGGTVHNVVSAGKGPLIICVTLDDKLIKQFEETSGFGLTK